MLSVFCVIGPLVYQILALYFTCACTGSASRNETYALHNGGFEDCIVRLTVKENMVIFVLHTKIRFLYYFEI